MACKSDSKILLPLIFLIAACGDIPRDNALDPKNPDSKSAQVVMIEAFVNTANPTQYNEIMLSALDTLAHIYNGRLQIAEYHRDTPDYQDPYHLQINESLYNNYLDIMGFAIKGVPDVFINGTQFRIQGASDKASALQRLEEVVLAATLNENSRISLQVEAERSENRIRPVITIARLGDRDIERILIKCVLVTDLNQRRFHHVSVGMVQGQLISRLKHGEHQIVELPELEMKASWPHRLIAYVTDASQGIIYQSAAMEVK